MTESQANEPSTKRRDERVQVRLPVEIEIAGVNGNGQTRNLSHSGTFVETTLPMRLGQRAKLLLTLPGSAPSVLLVEAEVRWVSHDGAGLQFVQGLRAGETWLLNKLLFPSR